MPFDAPSIVAALTTAVREVSEAGGRLQMAALDSAKEKIAALEEQTKEKITNTLLAIVSKLNT